MRKLALLVFVLLLAGCATTEMNDIKRCQYLRDTSNMQKGKYIDLLYVDNSVDFRNSKIMLAEPESRTYEKYCPVLLKNFKEQLTKKGFKVVDKVEVPDKALVLTLGYGGLDKGDAIGRWYFGCGVGATDVQVEGYMKDGEKMVFQFADRRKFSGNPTLGLNFAALDNDKCINTNVKEIAEAVAKTLAEIEFVAKVDTSVLTSSGGVPAGVEPIKASQPVGEEGVCDKRAEPEKKETVTTPVEVSKEKPRVAETTAQQEAPAAPSAFRKDFGSITQGMTLEQVELGWGKPDQIASATFGGAIRETWTYKDDVARKKHRVVFENGLVISSR